MVLCEISRDAANGLMSLSDRGRSLRRAVDQLKSDCSKCALPSGDYALACGTSYSIRKYDLAPHGTSAMYLAAAVVVCNGGFAAVRLVRRGGIPKLEIFEAGIGHGPRKLWEVA